MKQHHQHGEGKLITRREALSTVRVTDAPKPNFMCYNTGPSHALHQNDRTSLQHQVTLSEYIVQPTLLEVPLHKNEYLYTYLCHNKWASNNAVP